jgi:hypothetical protein
MTLIEIIFFILRAALSVGGGLYLYKYTNGPASALVAALLFGIFPVAVNALVEIIGGKGMGRPPCPNQRCGDNDYKWIGGINGKPICRCRCGIDLVSDGNVFYILLEDGKVIPYKRWENRKGWMDCVI